MTGVKKVTIIGVGLIGGSIGLAVKKGYPGTKVVGVFRRKATLKRALKHKAIDAGFMDVAKGVKDADLIIIASPVHLIPHLAEKAAKAAKRGAVITDAGSTKEWIVDKLDRSLRRFPGVSFVGSHPMAGSEHKGVEFASADLFKGSPCIVTKARHSDANALKKVSNFWRSLGGRVKVMSPKEHDRTVSLISHLPHVVAFALAGAVPGEDMACAAEGFRDTTRVASSDPALWSDIFLTNRIAILKAGRLFGAHYRRLLSAIARKDRSTTVAMLKLSKTKRDKHLYVK